MDDLIREVADATDPHGIVPKDELAERVISRGRDGGHDPDLIAERYADLVPEVLAERAVLDEDTDGNERTITVVHLRTETVTPQLAQLRSQFSSRVSGDLLAPRRRRRNDRSGEVAGTHAGSDGMSADVYLRPSP